MEPLNYTKHDDVIIIQPDGDLNSCHIMNIEGLLEEIVDPGTITIAVDCRKLFVLDPSTISQMAACMKWAAKNSIELVFYNLNPEAQLMFDMMHLGGLFTRISGEKFENDYMGSGALN